MSASMCNSQRVGDSLHFTGHQLARPFFWALKPLLGAWYLPSTPGPRQESSCTTRAASIAGRCLKGGVSLVGTAAAFPFAILGAVVQGCAKRISPRPYICLRGKAQEQRLEDKNECTLGDGNLCSFKGGFPTLFGGVAPAYQRTRDLARLILRTKATIFVGQEVSFGPALRIIGLLKNDYAHFITHVGPNPLGIETCLFVASKVAFVSAPIFEVFPVRKPGILRGLIGVETSHFWVITTHLEAAGPKNAAIRAQQLAFVVEKCKELQKLTYERDRTHKPVFVLGDLNCPPEDIPECFTNLYPKKYKETATCTNALDTWRRGYMLDPNNNELDDYALCYPSKESRVTPTHIELVRTFDLDEPERAPTDHHFLALKVSL